MSESIKKEKGHFRRNGIFYILILVALGFSGYLWMYKTIALKNQAKEYESEKILIIEQAQEAFQINSEKHLELMMKTFAWAVRGELTRGNQEQADQYFKQLVKADEIEEVTFVDNKQKILITTNKKNEGSKLATDYADTVMKIEEMMVFDSGDKHIAAAPIMGLNKHLGILLVIYNKDVFQIEDKVDLTNNQ